LANTGFQTVYNYIGLEPRREAMHWQFGEMKFGEMKRNTSNCSNFGMLLRRAGLTASAGLSCRVSICVHDEELYSDLY